MCITPNPQPQHLRLLLMAAFVLCAAVSGFAQSKPGSEPPQFVPPPATEKVVAPIQKTVAQQIAAYETWLSAHKGDADYAIVAQKLAATKAAAALEAAAQKPTGTQNANRVAPGTSPTSPVNDDHAPPTPQRMTLPEGNN